MATNIRSDFQPTWMLRRSTFLSCWKSELGYVLRIDRIPTYRILLFLVTGWNGVICPTFRPQVNRLP